MRSIGKVVVWCIHCKPLWRSIAAAFCCLALHILVPGTIPELEAGGVLYVAGVSSFDPNVAGQTITWANGNVIYFTDQGDAGPMLPQAAANDFVAEAISRWTSVPTAALRATRGGALAEDVNGTITNVGGGISLPADIQPSATDKPLAFVYDNDGQVTDALLGVGASDPTLCSTNSVVGGVDRFSTDAHIIHALIIINGKCAQTTTDLPALKYSLVRVLGQALGLGWSQANDNVASGSPFPSSEDYAGFPVMHPVEPFCGSAITTCIPNADQLRMDDRAAISKLYPVTQQNISSFTGKQILAANTIRVHGSIFFSDVHGNAGQPMQGVNVVARLVENGVPSRQYVSTSVSGFLFRGNAGNPVTGFGTSSQRYDAFGSGDPALEGFYDLEGLELPAGTASATYQITLEPVNPLYYGDSAVGPYALGPVSPSGTSPAITLTNLTAGTDIAQDIVMTGSARIATDSAEPNSFASPSPVPSSGQWWGSLSGYGDSDFFTLAAHANRSFSFQVTALNEVLTASLNKAQPVLGVWLASDPEGTPPLIRVDAFNGAKLGMTELDATSGSTGLLKLGIADYRGDGRPDFLYRARLLYADTLAPARINSGGAPLVIRGIGFRRGMSVIVGGFAANVIALDENQIVATAPSLGGGVQDISVQDPGTGGTSTMTGAITYGLLISDQIQNVSSANPTTAVGADAPNPIRVRVVAADGTTPLPGVAVTFSVNPGQSFFPICGSSVCVVNTDANGEASVVLSVRAADANTVTASISNGAHVTAAINGTSSLTLVALQPVTHLAAGVTTSIPLSVKLLNAGLPVSGQQISYTVATGIATLSSATASTDVNGFASINANLTNFTSSVSMVACPPSGPCAQFSLLPTPLASIGLQKIAGDNQVLLVGQAPQPISLRVVDASTPPNAIPNVPVAISGLAIAQVAPPDCTLPDGICRPAANDIKASFSATLNSDANGIVTLTPTILSAWGPVRIPINASAGSSASQSFDLKVVSPLP